MCIDEVEFIIVGGLCGCNYCGVFGLGVGIIRGSIVAHDCMIALVSNVPPYCIPSPVHPWGPRAYYKTTCHKVRELSENGQPPRDH